MEKLDIRALQMDVKKRKRNGLEMVERGKPGTVRSALTGYSGRRVMRDRDVEGVLSIHATPSISKCRPGVIALTRK